MKTRTRLAVLFLTSIVFFGCAGMAHMLGVETKEETDAKVAAAKAAGSAFGPYGELISGGIALILVAANNAYRNKTRQGALTNLANGTAGAIASSQSPAKVAEILTESLPGKAEVTASGVAEIVADAKSTTADAKAADEKS